MESGQWVMVSVDVRMLLLSVLGCTFIAFFGSMQLALKVWRQPLGLRGVAGHALASTVAFFILAVLVGALAPTEIIAMTGIVLGLIATQLLLAKRLLRKLQQRMPTPLPSATPSAWRMALVTVPASVALLAIVGTVQVALFFSPS